MPDDASTAGPDAHRQWRAILLTSLLCSLPALSPVFEGLRTFIPLAPFYYSTTMGEKVSRHICLFAFIITGIVSLLAGNIGNALFPLTLFPVGLALAWALKRKKSIAWAGLTATLLVLAGWLIGALLFWQASGTNPYSAALSVMDHAFASMAEAYTSSGDFAPEVAAEIEQGFIDARRQLPRIFPALLIISAMLVSWLNMALGNRLLDRHAPDYAAWPPYRCWRLPDNLIWLVILAGIMMIPPVTSLKTVGLNGLLITGTLYFFQGLAVLFAMMERWNPPRPIRIFIYIFIFIQTYSLVLLALLGIIDVWKDLGKIYEEDAAP